MTAHRRSQEPESAVFKPTRWPGLIWAVPVAALAVVAWLGIRDWLARGPHVTVEFPVVAGLQSGDTKIKYRGFEVGQVGDVRFSPRLDHMIVELQFKSSMSGHLGPGTRYWIAGTSADLGDFSSLIATVSGPYVGIDPRPGETVSHVQGLAAADAPGPKAVAYQVIFDGGPQGLKPWAPVRIEGAKIGSVTSVQTRYDAGGRKLLTIADLALDPDAVGLAGPEPLRRMLDAMVHEGLRAELGSSVPVIGGREVDLEMAPGAAAAAVTPGHPPRLPAHPGANVAEMMRQMQQLLGQTKDAVAQAQSLLNSENSANPAPGTSDLPHALYELQRAASSLRQLTDYLNQHPNALLVGRKP